MKKLFLVITLFSFVFWFTGCEKETLKSQDDIEILKKAGNGNLIPNTFDECSEMEIWAGVGNKDAGTLIGHATFDTTLGTITIDLDDGWKAEEVHIQFSNLDPNDKNTEFPLTKKGNPKVGHFDHNLTYDPPTDNIVIDNVDFKAYGAIHISALSCVRDEVALDAIFDWYKDKDIDMRLWYGSEIPREGYFSIELLDDGPLNGTYIHGHCLAPTVLINPNYNILYSARIFSSYDPALHTYLGGYGFEFGDESINHISLANWFINNYKVGDMIQPTGEFGSPIGGITTITWHDIQQAIWILASDFEGKSQYGVVYNKNVINAMAFYIKNNTSEWENFMPGCGENIIFVMVPLNSAGILQQPIMAWIPIPCTCEGEETAWGDGKIGATFPGNQWGTWFEYSNGECE